MVPLRRGRIDASDALRANLIADDCDGFEIACLRRLLSQDLSGACQQRRSENKRVFHVGSLLLVSVSRAKATASCAVLTS
jgi:hypothetical protein